MRKIVIVTLLVALILTVAVTARSQYYLGVVRGEARKIPIVVLDQPDCKFLTDIP